ncbi:TonB-dependent receptor plug domain-containing protein [Sphingomonas phyllosphaerae]|uniref:TonB-dependent receptor plug domain-containing protein n=1 Tax=Sphingomonas phyllosphaerae TaxID=257003 RepID=UPI002413A254|nr:TonB-dependent receptor [Sphingomonas phyllosphaerae]
MPSVSSRLSVAAALAAAVSSPALAQQTTDAAAEAADVVVTGSRDPTVTARQSASPITIVSDAALRSTGLPDLRDSMVQLVPSLSRPLHGLDQASLVDSISLRGLTADQTLVLVNGKRRHPTAAVVLDPGPQQGTAPVDLDLLPAAAIARVEVLEDGAAAQYGSDAIAGVINLILRDDTATEARALAGRTYVGDGISGALSAGAGVALGEGGHARWTAELVDRDRTDREGRDTRTGLYDNPAIGAPRTGRAALALDADYRLGAATLYGDASWARRGAGRLAFRRLGDVLPTLYPHGFQPEETIAEQDAAATIGARGGARDGWHWDLSTSYGSDRIDLGLRDTANLGLYAATGATPTAVAIGRYRLGQWTSTLDLRRPIALAWLAAPLHLALGGEYRRETYAIDPGEPAAYVLGGTQGYQGLSPDNRTHADRSVTAGYADLAVPLARAWRLDAAGRYEHYSDAGDTLTGKLATRLNLSDAFALRAGAGTGFRAPTLAQSQFSSIVVSPSYANAQVAVTSAAARALGAAPLRPERSTHLGAGAVARLAGSLDLTLDGYQIIVRDRIVTGGAYNGRIALDALALQGVTLPAGLTPESTAVQYYANGVRTRTRGFDLTLRYHAVLAGEATFDADLAGTAGRTEVTHVGRDQLGRALLDAQGIGYLTTAYPASRVVVGAAVATPRWDVTLHELRYGATRSQLTFYSGPDAFSTERFRDFTNAARWVTNVELGLRLAGSLRAAVGANNLFDAYPSRLPAANAYIGAMRYDLASQQLGQDGGFYYLRLRLGG